MVRLKALRSTDCSNYNPLRRPGDFIKTIGLYTLSRPSKLRAKKSECKNYEQGDWISVRTLRHNSSIGSSEGSVHDNYEGVVLVAKNQTYAKKNTRQGLLSQDFVRKQAHKLAIPNVTDIFAEIFSQCLEEGKFPEDWIGLYTLRCNSSIGSSEESVEEGFSRKEFHIFHERRSEEERMQELWTRKLKKRSHSATKFFNW